MPKISKKTIPKHSGNIKKFKAAVADHILHHLAFDNSFQANIITISSTGKIIVANNAACKLLGYSKKELLTKSRTDIFDINESIFKKMLKQRKTDGRSAALVTAIKKNGKPFSGEITSAVFLDEDGIEKAITTITDLSQTILNQKNIDTQKEKIVADDIVVAKSKQRGIDIKKGEIVASDIALAKSKQKKIDIEKDKIVAENIILALAKSDEEKLEQEIAAKAEYKKSFKLIFNSSSDVLFDADLIADKLIISDAYEKEFGYKIAGKKAPAEDWARHIHPDDKEAVMQDYQRMLASAETEWKYSYRFLKADNSVANVISSRIILRNPNGKAYRMIGSMQDISKQTVLEEKLALEIKLKEKQIAEATQDAKDAERSDIGRELHDNINQLLGASRMYLEMAKAGGKNSELYISRSSQYTLTAIEEIRNLTRGLTTDIIKNLGLCEVIETTARDMMEVNPVKISCELRSFEEDSVNDKFKHNIFRIVQEQLNNILKHAGAKKVIISLVQNEKSILLTISDDGIGFDTGKKYKGIGIDNIKNRAKSYDGIADFVSQPGQGCTLTVAFSVASNKDTGKQNLASNGKIHDQATGQSNRYV